MKTFTLLCALSVVSVCTAALPARADPGPILSQGFDDIGTLPGWLLPNRSQPAGQSWFQGNAGIFPAQAGAPDAYIAANFLSAQDGQGSIDNWLITPELTLSGPTQLSFYTRSAGDPGFADTLEVRFGDGSDPAAFTQTLLGIGGASAYPSDWQQYAATLNVSGSGRFAFRYTGPASGADYIGIDSIAVAAVPEPSCSLLLAAGLGLMGWRAWRRPRAGDTTSATPVTVAALAAATALCLSQPALAQQSAQWPDQWPNPWQQDQGTLAEQTAAPAQSGDGMVVVRDAVTGQLRAPTPAEFHALQVQAAALRGATANTATAGAPPRVSLRADGTRQAHLGQGGQVYMVTRRAADGALGEQCVQGEEAAARLLEKANADSRENGHENE
jgi:hypothetical protein